MYYMIYMLYLFKIILNSELCYDSLFVKNKVKYLNNDFMLNDKQIKHTNTTTNTTNTDIYNINNIRNNNNINNNISNINNNNNINNISNKYNLTLIALKERTLEEKLRIIKILKRNQYKIKNNINTNDTNNKCNDDFNVNVITTNDNKRIKKLIELYKNIINSVTYVDRREIVRICDIIENITNTDNIYTI
ncbi:hypothetical protein EHP00_2481 [Ecytonucleospora hepatopenaei]|uniref:Uncharacterized protein n=1 Tax=Ecytonucleospora hepatopenaei TaxID=646526 RepID=A0A1W0E2R2_9MICR|nr:hypothetical protein EHP00_2481 [Ecytonucleospora hepatopenaei]